MRWLFVSAALLLFVFSGIQYNDPDPIYWIAVYGMSGFVVLGKGVGRFNRTLAVAVLGAIVAGLLIAMPGFSEYLVSGNQSSIFGSMSEADHVERAREFLGLTITGIIIVWCIKR